MKGARIILQYLPIFAAGATAAMLTANSINQERKFDVYWENQKISSSGLVIDGTAYVPATELAKHFNTSVQVDPPKSVIRFGAVGSTGGSSTGQTTAPASQSNAPFEKELVTNGNFEAGDGAKGYYDELVSIPGWQRTGKAQVGWINDGSFAIPEALRPADTGNKYFVGGWGDSEPVPVLRQTIGLSAFSEDLKFGAVKFNLKALMGAPSEEDVRGHMLLTFLDKNNKALATITVKSPAITELTENGPQMLPRSANGSVPKEAASAVIQLKLSDHVNNWHGVYVDNVSLMLSR
ncbi:MAG: hypothetical protein KDC26_12865 [Armatimonadetes bacterium]|nr:hypothetical protein [Armatimonadota bacterium]